MTRWVLIILILCISCTIPKYDPAKNYLKQTTLFIDNVKYSVKGGPVEVFEYPGHNEFVRVKLPSLGDTVTVFKAFLIVDTTAFTYEKIVETEDPVAEETIRDTKEVLEPDPSKWVLRARELILCPAPLRDVYTAILDAGADVYQEETGKVGYKEFGGRGYYSRAYLRWFDNLQEK